MKIPCNLAICANRKRALEAVANPKARIAPKDPIPEDARSADEDEESDSDAEGRNALLDDSSSCKTHRALAI